MVERLAVVIGNILLQGIILFLVANFFGAPASLFRAFLIVFIRFVLLVALFALPFLPVIVKIIIDTALFLYLIVHFFEADWEWAIRLWLLTLVIGWLLIFLFRLLLSQLT